MDLFAGLHLRKVGTNTLAQFIVKLVTSGTTLAATILITYSLGFSVFGSFSKMILITSFFYLFIDFGLNAVFLQKHFEDTREKTASLIALRLLIAGILFLASLIITLALPYSPANGTGFSPFEKVGIILFSITFFPTAVNISLGAFLQQRLLYPLSLVPNIFASLVLLLFVVLGTYYHNLYIIVLGYAVGGAALAFLIFNSLHKRFSLHLKIPEFKRFATSLLTASSPLALMLVLNLIYARADSFILALFKPTVDVGIYNFSYRIFDFLIALPTFAGNAIYPVLLASQNEEGVFRKRLTQYAFLLFLVSLITAFFAFFAAPFLVLLKPDFAASRAPLQILSLSLPFFFLTSLFQWVFIIKNKKTFLVAVYFVSLVLNIGLNILLIPRFSYYASAYLTVLGEGIVFVLMISFLAFSRPKIFKEGLQWKRKKL